MKALLEISTKMDRLWRESREAFEAFPDLAVKVLEDLDYRLSLADLEAAVAEWSLGVLPEQINLHNSFGQPPLTIFNNGKFVVDLYFWVNFDTSLHSHGFRGAFRVLHGRSLHEEFSARVLKTFSKDILFTDLGLPTASILREGDVRVIRPELNHRVIHLENPTVTLCVKTINEPELFQWNYFANGLAIQKRGVPPALIKAVYYFQYLAGRDLEAAADYLERLLTPLEPSLQMNLYEDVAGGSLDLSEDCAHLVLENIVTRFGEVEWFKLYEEAFMAAAEELDFSFSDSPTDRLLGHAVNSGYPRSRVKELLSELGETPALEEVVSSLAEQLPAEQAGKLRKILD